MDFQFLTEEDRSDEEDFVDDPSLLDLWPTPLNEAGGGNVRGSN